MVTDSLYKIISLNQLEKSVDAAVELNINDSIFSGHFPGQPVLPGACMLQIVKEVLEKALGKPMRLKVADQMKFLKIIDPVVNKMLTLKGAYVIDGESILITATMNVAEETVFKLKGVFVFINDGDH